MRRVSSKAILGTVAVGALLAGCATTVEMGPGYYHYDTGLAGPAPKTVVTEPAVVSAPAVVTAPVVTAPTIVTTPRVVYEQPPVTTYSAPSAVYYRDAPVVYRAPSVVYSPDKAAPYFDHAQ